jgi:Asp-tRNA(Asn)/Glu-tRNA(Gln) amidotransferase A subunit family amidase
MASNSRRDFLVVAASFASTAAALAAGDSEASSAPAAPAAPAAQAAGSVPEPAEITANTIAEAERLLGASYTESEREQILRTIAEHRDLLRSVRGEVPNELAPATVFHARLPGKWSEPLTTAGDPNALPPASPAPANDEDLAFATLAEIATWLRDRVVTSERLVEVSLARIARLDPTLKACITIVAERARAAAKEADAEIAAGRWRGPLHGVPYGLKDIVDTDGIATTWGAEPWRDRVPRADAVVATRLANAGAILVAKTAVGALAYGGIWHGGMCRSPWNTERGSSGSSAGSASGVAAGLFPFAIGSETLGSIVSPCDRCGAAGLRPTFGRVARTGTMSLVPTMDKLGPIVRSIGDAAIVLAAINGADPGDPSSIDMPFVGDPNESPKGLVVGYDPMWTRDNPWADVCRAAVEAARDAGCEVVEFGRPRLDPRPAILSLYAEAAATFADLVRTNRDDELSWQADEAWPNTFRRALFVPAIDFLNADRIRRRRCHAMFDLFDQLHAVIAPPFAGDLLVHTNWTGQPCAVFRAGFGPTGEPMSMTVMTRLFDEGTALRVATAIERRLGVWSKRPPV